jgi:DNA helicase-2/ATP-dependent DNA helicase PcrA
VNFQGFNNEQIEAIKHKDGNCIVLANPGSGKTKIITCRIAYLIEQGISPDSILAITFSRKSANEMKERLNKMIPDDVKMNTFHSVCYGILKVENSRFNDVQLVKDWQKKKFIVDTCIKDLSLHKEEKKVKVNDILRFISFNKNNFKLCTDKNLIELKDMPYTMDTMKKIYTYYTAYMNRNNVIEFDDMLSECVDFLIKHENIRKKYANKFKYILVDEFQDSCYVQMKFLELISKENQNVFVVGDVKQSIYKFRAADINIALNFYKEWNAKTIVLPMNYRSSSNIVQFCNKLMIDSNESKHPHYKVGVAFQDSYKDPEYNVYRTQKDEANSVANKIKELMEQDKELKYKDFAILFRTNCQSRSFEYALFQAGIPYVLPDCGSFYQKKEIQHMINYLKLALDTKNKNAFMSIYNSPSRYLGAKFISECESRAEKSGKSLYDAMFTLSGEWRYRTGIDGLELIINKIKRLIGVGKYNVGDIIGKIRDMTEYDDYVSGEVADGDTNEKIENLDSLVAQAKEYTDVEKFIKDIEVLIKTKEGDKDNKVDKMKYIDAVQCMTIHRSKGLEWKIVFVVGINEDILPHWKCEDDTAEELRLFFVACSRPEQELYLSSTLYFNNEPSVPSDFLYNVYDESVIEDKIQESMERKNDESNNTMTIQKGSNGKLLK